jgi:uncharacterized protein
MSAVSCGTCRACCLRDRIFLHPKEDDHTKYRYHIERVPEGRIRVLDRKADGSCAYLSDSGCSIHDSKPYLCKEFDCRVLVQQTPPERQAIRIMENPTMKLVYAAGRERLAYGAT